MIEKEENIQLAENEQISVYEHSSENEYDKKRKLLLNTKIVKQTWSIIEICQKIKDNKLILNPEYQRNVIWDSEKKTAFIESLYMGIIIPPVYVVEIPSENILEGNKYEVVDGKQRLSTIYSFINNEFKLKEKNLEYYADIFAEKTFNEIQENNTLQTNEMLSSVLDVYVITANSPEFTKYDIFSRLNKGSEKLKVNEIRKAIYRSYVTDVIEIFVNEYINDEAKKQEYLGIFSINNIKRYDDYGRFYKSLAFYVKTDLTNNFVKDYNSRPREMINDVLQSFQKKAVILSNTEIINILEKTLILMKLLKGNQYSEYLVDSLIPFACEYWNLVEDRFSQIIADEQILKTFEKSPSTTANVNERIKRVAEILKNE